MNDFTEHRKPRSQGQGTHTDPILQRKTLRLSQEESPNGFQHLPP